MPSPFKITIDQYLRMMRDGIILEGAPIELLDGEICPKLRAGVGKDQFTVGFAHSWAIQSLYDVLDDVKQLGFHIGTQHPVAFPPFNVPEPDGVIIRGEINDYRDRYPGAADAPCVIEVAEASLEFDRTTKARIYAQGGIQQYVVINLVDRQAEVFEQPIPSEGRYQTQFIVRPEEKIRFSLGQGRTIDADMRSLLPR